MAHVPKDHPRYASLMARYSVADGVKLGITTITGLTAHGRGEAFDYLLGEISHPFADRAAKAAAAAILLAARPVISINGNSAVLSPREMISLAKSSGALLEVNLFYDTGKRRAKIGALFKSRYKVSILGVKPDKRIKGLSSHRALVDSRGIYSADVVIVSIEDGDRTLALKNVGKRVIAIDLNPFSRTPQTADISIIDNVQRAFPLIEKHVRDLRKAPQSRLKGILARYDNKATLKAAIERIRKG
jgi:4-phosphopantoate--beta-alanine ligase